LVARLHSGEGAQPSHGQSLAGRFLGDMTNGTVKWFSPKKGYGFITLKDGQEVFVHYSAIDGQGFRSLEQGEEVSFEVAQGPKGLQAAKVMRR
jgi:CspA family cold shock protein